MNIYPPSSASKSLRFFYILNTEDILENVWNCNQFTSIVENKTMEVIGYNFQQSTKKKLIIIFSVQQEKLVQIVNSKGRVKYVLFEIWHILNRLPAPEITSYNWHIIIIWAKNKTL